MKNAKKILNQIKNSEKDIDFVIVTPKNDILANSETGNLMGIFYHNLDGEKFYGVYSDIINTDEFDGQVDSRRADDETILKYIERLLSYGEAVNRDSIDAKNGISRNYICWDGTLEI